MKRRFKIWSSLLWTFLDLACCSTTRAQITQPQFVRHQFIGPYFYVSFFPQTNLWLGLEVSTNLVSWTNWMNSITVRTNSITIGDEQSGRVGLRFYRVTAPGVAPEDARAKWLSRNIQDYRFDFLSISENAGFAAYAGTVSIKDGQKTVIDPKYNGQPQSPQTVNPADFPSIDELLGRLENVALSRTQRVQVQYDPDLSFPAAGFITPDSYDYRFWISNFVSSPTLRSAQPATSNSLCSPE